MCLMGTSFGGNKMLNELGNMSQTWSNQNGQLRILIVEDNPVQQLLTGNLLKELGHSIRIVGNGFAALSAVQQDSYYDVILMDCQMPLMDGFQATRFIRQIEHARGEQTAIIGMSANPTAEECFKVGMDDFLGKPLKRLILKAILGRSIRNKTGRALASNRM